MRARQPRSAAAADGNAEGTATNVEAERKPMDLDPWHSELFILGQGFTSSTAQQQQQRNLRKIKVVQHSTTIFILK
jgi:hypothetical protein